MRRTEIQGHRGARGLRPENTLAGFAFALGLGVRTLELDVGMSRDGVLVVHHDRRLNPDLARAPTAQGLAWIDPPGPLLYSLEAAQIRRFDVGRIRPASATAARFPDQQPVDGATIPTLAELLDLCRGWPGPPVRLNIETKVDPRHPAETADPARMTRALIRALCEAGMAARATIQSFDWRTLALVQAEAPQIPTVYLSTAAPGQSTLVDTLGGTLGGTLESPLEGTGAAASPWTAGLRLADYGSAARMVAAAGGRIWSPDFRDLDEHGLAEARHLGLSVIAWTVNEVQDIDRLLGWGVEGLITDYPDRALARQAVLGLGD